MTLSTLRPSHLPKIRDQLIRHEEDHDSYLWRIAVFKVLGFDRNDLEIAPAHLHDARLYFVTEDMTAQAMAAGGKLDEARWADPDRPAPKGLLWWDGGTGLITSQLGMVAIDACSWGPSPDGRMALWLYTSRRRLVDQAPEYAAKHSLPDIDLEAMLPPLVPLAKFDLPVTIDPILISNLASAPKPLCAALAAAWLLMEQPTVAERSEETAERSLRRAYARAGRPDPSVSIIDLRRVYHVQQDANDPSGAPDRLYRHRWAVSGHWRTYRAERYSEERRRERQWIPDYEKGPDGAPMLRTERVNVWRR